MQRWKWKSLFLGCPTWKYTNWNTWESTSQHCKSENLPQRATALQGPYSIFLVFYISIFGKSHMVTEWLRKLCLTVLKTRTKTIPRRVSLPQPKALWRWVEEGPGNSGHHSLNRLARKGYARDWTKVVKIIWHQLGVFNNGSDNSFFYMWGKKLCLNYIFPVSLLSLWEDQAAAIMLNLILSVQWIHCFCRTNTRYFAMWGRTANGTPHSASSSTLKAAPLLWQT